MDSILEKIISTDNYDDLGLWLMPELSKFSDQKTLFEYQNIALKNITKVLHKYFERCENKNDLLDMYNSKGFKEDDYKICKFETKNKRNSGIINKKFSFFQNHFRSYGYSNDEYISISYFLNRACFWMATGSGKSLVIIKTIELIDYLISHRLIPKKEIMLLLPRDDLIRQFSIETYEYNRSRERKIEIVNLRNYEDDKQRLDFGNTIKVYCCRSDLLRNERKENILDYRSYENNGDWYVFLDEAHRGKADESLLKNYVSVLSKNGFLFNFSATFTENIDFATVCFNFNLEKFIMEGYGKNIYLSKSYFDFTKDKDDFSEREKQKQVLKSLIIFTLVKKVKPQDIYHNPLLITLVNSINTKDADLLLFFKKLEETANGKIEQGLFNDTKGEVLQELINNTSYVFGSETLNFEMCLLKDISEKDLLNQVFNADSYGKIEILEGEKGKEIVLKLETSEKPFALIKIGDTRKFKKEQLGTNYSIVTSFDSKKYFENINKNENINLLIGSRSFYEGWDSNRPNVISMINIGKKDAKKFVLQGIGRGIRIEPHKGERKRLDQNNPNKSSLLETLFVFATDKNAVKAIIETVENQKNKEEQTITLSENIAKPFDLLIPVYNDIEKKEKIAAKFNIAEESLRFFKNYINCLDSNTLLIKTAILQENLKSLIDGIGKDHVFQTRKENVYTDMGLLLQRIIDHLAVKSKTVSGIKQITEEIIHFKHIKVVNFSDSDLKLFNDEIEKVKNYEELNESDIDDLFDSGKITRQDYKKKIIAIAGNKEQGAFKDLIIRKIARHYYLPLIYSEKEKADYIKHVIKTKSEVNFIKALEKHIKGRTFDFEWMFSKIDESIDSLYMPYFYRKENIYRKFYPDFIFWIKKGLNYKIVFADPKGTAAAAYQNKADEFEKLFLENSIPKTFKYKDFKITFDLKFIGDSDLVGEQYKKYWDQGFNFLAMPGYPVSGLFT